MSAIVDCFCRVARDYPHRPLLHLASTGITLNAWQVWETHLRYRDHLTRLGIGANDLVLSASGNRAGTFPLLLASWAAGAAVMPVDASMPPAEIADLAQRFHASAIVLSSDAAAKHAGASHQLDDELVIVRRHDAPPASLHGAALLKVTSGSTGIPKAVLASETNLVDDTEHITAAMGIAPADTQVAAIPLSHAYGFGNLLMPVFLHGTAIVLRDSFVPHLLSSDARRFGARVFHGVPFMFQYFIANHPPWGWPTCLRLLISAGAPLDAATIRAFHQRFGLKIHSFYGATEAGGITFDSSDAIDCDATVGWAIPGVTVGLQPDEGIPTGYGRVHVRSSAVAGGYAGEAGGDGFVDGGFLTGDYGRFSADGRLVLGGRVSAFINVAGRKVHPAEVESALRSLDGVADVRVLAVDDRTRGEQIAAVIVCTGALTVADVRRQCTGILAPYKIPRTVLFVDEIPMTERGKTDRQALAALVGQHLHGS